MVVVLKPKDKFVSDISLVVHLLKAASLVCLVLSFVQGGRLLFSVLVVSVALGQVC